MRNVLRAVRGFAQRHTVKLGALATATIGYLLLSSSGADEAADIQRDKMAEIAAQIIVCEMRGGEACDGVGQHRDPLAPTSGPSVRPTNPPLSQPPADFRLPEPVAQAAPTSAPVPAPAADERLKAKEIQIDQLKAQVVTLERRLEEKATTLGRTDSDLDQLKAENLQLRRALAAKDDETDALINEAVMAAELDMKEKYDAQVCFARDEWNAYRLDLDRVCRSAGPQRPGSSDGG